MSSYFVNVLDLKCSLFSLARPGPHSKLEAFQIRAYGKALVDGQSPWGQIRPGSMPPTLIYNIEFPIPVIFEVGEFL